MTSFNNGGSVTYDFTTSQAGTFQMLPSISSGWTGNYYRPAGGTVTLEQQSPTTARLTMTGAQETTYQTAVTTRNLFRIQWTSTRGATLERNINYSVSQYPSATGVEQFTP